MSDKRQRQRQREFRYHFIKDKEEPTQTQKGLSFLLSVKSSSLFSLSSFPLSRLSRLHFLFSFYTFLSVTLPSLPFYILFLSSHFSLSPHSSFSPLYKHTQTKNTPAYFLLFFRQAIYITQTKKGCQVRPLSLKHPPLSSVTYTNNLLPPLLIVRPGTLSPTFYSRLSLSLSLLSSTSTGLQFHHLLFDNHNTPVSPSSSIVVLSSSPS